MDCSNLGQSVFARVVVRCVGGRVIVYSPTPESERLRVPETFHTSFPCSPNPNPTARNQVDRLLQLKSTKITESPRKNLILVSLDSTICPLPNKRARMSGAPTSYL